MGRAPVGCVRDEWSLVVVPTALEPRGTALSLEISALSCVSGQTCQIVRFLYSSRSTGTALSCAITRRAACIQCDRVLYRVVYSTEYGAQHALSRQL